MLRGVKHVLNGYITQGNPPKHTMVNGARRSCQVDSGRSAKARPNRTLLRSRYSRFCLAASIVKRIAFASENLVFQHALEKFLWPLRQITWLRVASALSAVFANLIAWAGMAILLTRRGLAAHQLDLNIVRLSLIILMVSFSWAWTATSETILAFGMLQYSPVNG